jgi:hypothetical protein
MNKCVFYLRDQAGKIQPIENLGEVPRDGLLGSYPFEEPLTNFTETIVFWSMKSGPCVGVAPVTNS